jgi:MFS family permease
MPSQTAAPPRSRTAAWFARWQPILPLLLAEFVLWLGFGALLPILPIYFRDHGIDLAMLGLVVAAWPAARLVAEPIFGWIADRTARKPLMVGALLASAIVIPLPLVFTGPIAFIVLRAAAGLATAAYDPAARGYLVDATPAERQGEAFGLYGAAQMGGLMVGPAIGGLGAALVGSQAFVFLFGAVSSAIAGLVVALVVRERPQLRGALGFPPEGVAEMTSPVPSASSALAETAHAAAGRPVRRSPSKLANRLLIAAIIVNAGANYGSGTYEVMWSLYLSSLGAHLDLIGATFAAFGIPILFLSPIAGRLVDRRGGLAFIIVGSLMAAAAAIMYTFMRDPTWAIPIILLESAGTAFTWPALFAVVAAGSPAGRSSTAQGLFGSAGTVGFIISSVVAGRLASIDLRYPFWMFSAVVTVTLVIGLAVGWGPIRAIHPAGAKPRRSDREQPPFA